MTTHDRIIRYLKGRLKNNIHDGHISQGATVKEISTHAKVPIEKVSRFIMTAHAEGLIENVGSCNTGFKYRIVKPRKKR